MGYINIYIKTFFFSGQGKVLSKILLLPAKKKEGTLHDGIQLNSTYFYFSHAESYNIVTMTVPIRFTNFFWHTSQD